MNYDSELQKSQNCEIKSYNYKSKKKKNLIVLKLFWETKTQKEKSNSDLWNVKKKKKTVVVETGFHRCPTK